MKKYLPIAILIIIAYIINSIILYKKVLPYNQSPLKINTFDNSNSPYHPSVLFFQEGWKGYKYWMAETPYSPASQPYRDRNECPSIHFSNDGISWFENENPIDDLNDKDVKELDYFSDPELVLRNDTLECWYRLTSRKGESSVRNNVYLLRKKSCDGVNWENRDTLVSLKTGHSSLGNMVVSPAVIHHNGSYQMWYVNSENKEREILFSTSIDGKNWDETRKCILDGQNRAPWHIDISYIDNKFILICYDFHDITLYESGDKINFNKISTILTPSRFGSFYGNGLYRASLIKDKEYKLYFSCDDMFKTHIGLMRGNSLNNLKVYDNGTKYNNYVEFLLYKIYADWVHYSFIIKNGFKKLVK